MAKSVIRFSFPGNITWGDTIKDDWAPILVDYIKNELTIGNGTFLNTEHCLSSHNNQNLLFNDYSATKQVIAEIICDIPKSATNNEFDIRAKLITLLEDLEFDFIKFHNCGPSRNAIVDTTTLKK